MLLRANVTANNADDQALLLHFNIIGPPTIAFYGTDGHERPQYRVVGYMKADGLRCAARAGAANVRDRVVRRVRRVRRSQRTWR